MIAVDTNVLVRVLTNDDPMQAGRAMKLLRSSQVWVTRTVILETEWVLRHAYGLDVSAIVRAFNTLAGVPTVDLAPRQVPGCRLEGDRPAADRGSHPTRGEDRLT